jgi:competence ComEA-like helix-hairpin-helix protein
MVFTAAERRLLALLVLFLGLGYLLTGVRHCAGVDSAREARAEAAGGDSAAAPACSASAESGRVVASPDSVDAFVGGYLDLNAADSLALLALPGIGPAFASRILAYRRAHGGFTRVEELRGVKGIGPKRLERLRALVTVGPRRR